MTPRGAARARALALRLRAKKTPPAGGVARVTPEVAERLDRERRVALRRAEDDAAWGITQRALIRPIDMSGTPVPIFRFGTPDGGLRTPEMAARRGGRADPLALPWQRLVRVACFDIPTPHRSDGFMVEVQQHERCVLLDEHLRRAVRCADLDGGEFLVPEGALWGALVPASALRIGLSQALVPDTVLKEAHRPLPVQKSDPPRKSTRALIEEYKAFREPKITLDKPGPEA